MTDSAVVIGAGHNGLVCAFYLARAGLKVTVLERRNVVGGAAVTETFHPGFRNSTASYTVSLLNPKVIADMGLTAQGLRVVERRMANFLPLPDGDHLIIGEGRTRDEVARFSRRDAQALNAYVARLEAVADVVRALVLVTPPNMPMAGGPLEMLRQLGRGLGVGRQLSHLGLTARRDLLALFSQSAGDWLDGWFESAPIKAAFGFDGVVGTYASPYSPGTAYVLLHHVFGEVNGKKSAWGHAIGGMGAITQAMAGACRDLGVEIRTDTAVAEVITQNGRARGVATSSGEVHAAGLVVSNLHPKLLFDDLVDPSLLTADFRERIARYRSGSGTFRMNVALSELPRFTAMPNPGDHLTGGIIIAPSLDYMDRAHMDARLNGWSREPIVEMLIPSTLDDSLAPPGRHVASLFCQHVAPRLADGRSWDDCREEVADLMIATVDRWAPGFKASVIARQIFSPLDLERTFGLVGGDIMHGALSLDQMFSARPVLGYGDYRTPVPGLYQCGAGTHPGGGVTGAPGHNAAREILRDLRRSSPLPRPSVQTGDKVDVCSGTWWTGMTMFCRKSTCEITCRR
jgi:phytoene dehydrogenase-like protein